jgi:hypothetical protein
VSVSLSVKMSDRVKGWLTAKVVVDLVTLMVGGFVQRQ